MKCQMIYIIKYVITNKTKVINMMIIYNKSMIF